MSELAPIAVFAYARPDHLRSTLLRLSACDRFAESAVTVFIDGPKTPDKAELVSAVIEVAKSVLGNKADIRASATNQGLAQAITGGVGALLAARDRVIVLEDDLEVAPCFLDYMNASLERYADDPNVFQVSGHMFDVSEFACRDQAMLLPLTTTWGWGTWSRAWSHFDPKATGWEQLRSDRALRRRFDLEGTYPFSQMLESQMSKGVDSWGIRWYWSVFRLNGLSVFPSESLVHNAGQDGSGTHGAGLLADYSGQGLAFPVRAPTLPDVSSPRLQDLTAVKAAIWRQNGGWRGWAFNKLRRALRL